MSLPDHVQKAADEAMANLLPLKSSDRYHNEYGKFIKWCSDNNVKEYTEPALLAYFNMKSQINKSSTLWTIYSMLKSTLNINHNVNISNYHRLITFLKRKGEDYKPQKSNVLTLVNMEDFIKNAPNHTYLMMKAACIIRISGACRRAELTSLTTENVKFVEKTVIVTLCDTKVKSDRTFVITNEDWVTLVKSYYALRPLNVPHNRFFIYYAHNKCTRQVVGINSFGNMPRKYAEFLHLPNPKGFTGHCFRRSSATILSSKGADFLAVKRLGGWKSSAVAEGYIEDSLHSKMAIATTFCNKAASSTATEPPTSCNLNAAESSSLNMQRNEPGPSTSCSIENVQQHEISHTALENVKGSLVIKNCQHFTINFVTNK